MTTVPEFSLDDLRERSLEVLKASGAEPNEHEFTRIMTDTDLEITSGPSYLRIAGTVVDFAIETHGADVDYEIEYIYGVNNSPQINRWIWKNNQRPDIKTIPRRDHNKVATELVRLFFEPEQVSIAN